MIGAGVSGLTATKALNEAGFDVTCFEQSDRIGGLWVLGNKNGVAAAYASLTTNTSRERTQFSDFAMPEEWPHYPRHDQILTYLEAYVEFFTFRDRIVFNTEIKHAARSHDGGWDLTFADSSRRSFDALVVACGHHWDPRFPDPPIPGEFAGTQMHARDFIEAAAFEDRRVAVVGMGNSAMDIAVDCSYVAAKTFLVGRHGVHIIPKTFFGQPSDRIRRHPWLPFRVRRIATALLTRASVGDQSKLGLAKPDHALLSAHPTLSDDVFPRLAAGAIIPKPEILELLGDRVRFADGSVETVDAIIYCTGYRFTYPFFAPEFAVALDDTIPLFQRVFPIGASNLFFIGVAQAVGSIFPFSEAQSNWLVDYLQGRYALPSEKTMRADVVREQADMRRRYPAIRPHPAQVDVDLYLAGLASVRRAGKPS